MYRRYSQAGDGAVPHSQRNRNLIKNILILILTLALAAACVIGLPAVFQRKQERAILTQRIQGECDEALRQTSLLSRSAGADSTAMLARVRSNLYAIRLANSLCGSFGNGTLLNEEDILAVQDSVDRYLTYLTMGMDTGEYQTNLSNDLTALQQRINALE